MKSRVLILVVITSFFVSCGQQEQLKAKIFERRELKGNRLMIRYEYSVNNKVYTDSATVANVVINSDSISVIIDPLNPSKSLPDIIK
ncbi:MAG: hypothetical protein JWQ09_1977 [Segetibacter sp.]|nr:hypothetical protein [Segetibacter sp.]